MSNQPKLPPFMVQAIVCIAVELAGGRKRSQVNPSASLSFNGINAPGQVHLFIYHVIAGVEAQGYTIDAQLFNLVTPATTLPIVMKIVYLNAVPAAAPGFDAIALTVGSTAGVPPAPESIFDLAFDDLTLIGEPVALREPVSDYADDFAERTAAKVVALLAVNTAFVDLVVDRVVRALKVADRKAAGRAPQKLRARKAGAAKKASETSATTKGEKRI